MLDTITNNYAVGNLVGLVANGTIAILYSATLSFYRKSPLRFIFISYFILTAYFGGRLLYGLQLSEESILLGYKIVYASQVLLPVSWVWFSFPLFNERKSKLFWIITASSLSVSFLSFFGRGAYFFDLPLEINPLDLKILRPHSIFFRTLVQSYCLCTCLIFFFILSSKLRRIKGKQQAYIVYLAIGLSLCWLFCGLNDAFLCHKKILVSKEQLLWLASIGHSIFITTAVIIYFRSVDYGSQEDLKRLNKVKSKALDHLSHELRTPLSVIRGNVLHLKRMYSSHLSFGEEDKFFEAIDRQLNQLSIIQAEADKIIRFYQEHEKEDRIKLIDLK